MARKKIGHVELQWTCPNCGGINPGPVKSCQACGAPQPEDIQFEQTDRQELIAEEEKIAQAEAGADIHCPFCGTRNPADAQTCSQCGGDIAEGVKRETGQVVGAFQTGPVEQVPCPRCGAENPDTAKTCQQCGAPMQRELEEAAPLQVTPTQKKAFPWMIIGAVAAVAAICALLFFIFFKTDEVTGIVQSVNWERAIPIEAFGPVKFENWSDQIPAEGVMIACEEKYHYTQDEPVANAVEVCGTPYNVDTGGGFAEVVQDCVYEVYDDYCEYSINQWFVVDTFVLTGSGYDPAWPEPDLQTDQRLGDERQESYVIVFDTDDGIKRFTTTSYELFQEAQIGTTWTLEVNQIDGVVRISK